MTLPKRAAIGAVVIAALGCGPIRYTAEVNRASDALEAARAVHADRLAPYWWTRATEYLHAARELAGHADFQAADHYGQIAEAAARQAAQAAVAAANPPAAPAPESR
jgi:hypothetical protein